ncbi:isoleucine--tRNA ligase [Patescibacteria group bacterium]|nr:isoleucine--tRNA ligase [Patescibacteria group bacterium]MBU0776971.1 isoleucine--tRNA ligase [Patescibacteria group bacterium]MBU0923000.1 isoleucine--tRNA ligase [Patescibacteria group bacterium]MBU1066933.1 isoleucine--tRNA ligase [Patescibacteria group bacterium]MBU1844640.1 isoleucine--tRNA ligase [Patescibacteria group bacterium]
MAKDRPFFDEVNIKADFSVMERELLDEWYEKGIIKKYLQKNKNSKKYFSFLDGPITANNPMGVHHAWGRTYKDIWQRYKNMQGFKQRFQNGFDCQGLWVEVEVEKELGLKSKKDIENLIPGDMKGSLAKFVDLCKKRVYKYADIQTEQSKRLGYIVDWDNSYYTLSDNNNYMIWHFLKKCHDEGLIYKGRDSVPWCPRCGTAISQHEMLTEDYKDLTHDALYVAYPIDQKENEHLLIWTTTPWTLPANVAVAVDPKLTYVLASSQDSDKKYYLSEKTAGLLGLKILEKVKGEKLIGLTYKSAFDNLPRIKKALSGEKHRVVATADRILTVGENEGTGLVHIATGAGSEDFALGKKEGLPVIEVIDEEANYLDELGEFAGKNAKDDPELIINYLEEQSFLFKKEKYKHRYPACWRCKTELVWRVVDEWYIKIDPVRENMKGAAKKIQWIPSFGLKRELDWLSNMHDWLISKKRYWGLAIPIWECDKCGHFDVIGSKEELKKKAIEGWEKFEGNTPHRPWIDEVKIKCEKCGETATRIPDVGNPWLDAGIVSFSTISADNKETPLYWQDKKEWAKWFPADFITESFPGQFKNWFYSLIAMSTVLENKEPTKTILGFATLLDEKGQSMHKSSGNMIEFNEGADKIGVDVMRWLYARQNPSENLLFGHKIADETRRRFHLKIWNVYNFFVTYANIDGWTPSDSTSNKDLNVLDRWILSRLNELINGVTKYLDEYNAYRTSGLIEEFVDDFSNWYIRRSRDRVGPAAREKTDKDAFYQTTHFVLVALTKLIAPLTPYLADFIYMNLTKKESVHVEDWPDSDKNIDKELMNNMIVARELAEKAHSERKKAEIPVRQPLNSLTVSIPELSSELEALVKDEVNVKNISWAKTEGEELKVKLDTKVTKELEEEAKARELIRKIQGERKKLGMNLTQEIVVANTWIPKSKEVVQKVKNKTLATDLKEGKFSVTKAS